ncbi:hypothetical protein DCMF_24790 [Candidatus Formimonas warabiya]|uniref:Uncharacterized protein n=2 Tax=Formimonas warabiya TaxID=1761012 RepID=A0A3G1L266_FORW1|nr:hypothetical protein [Candidatus Formimonas warabiya]ATW28883.1 hypothetical protein DCMF_24790 [Candidatus Formimonas warabiya]
MQCEKCRAEIPEGEEMRLHGKIVCEDCYVIGVQPPKTCDVAAVHSAKMHRQMSGQTGTEGLSDVQKSIYEFVKLKEKVTKDQLAEHFNLPLAEIERQFTVLRHCELLKGTKEGNAVYIVVMNQ